MRAVLNVIQRTTCLFIFDPALQIAWSPTKAQPVG